MEETKKSGVKGVSWNKKTQKWIVKLANKYFGSFDNLDDAIKKRKEVETPKTTTRFCVVCGKPIPPDRHKNATTCSDACVKEKSRRYMKAKYEEYKQDPNKRRNGNRMHAFSVFIPKDTLEELKETAHKRGITTSEYIRELLQQGIENEKRRKKNENL